ncbi:hypothetical protein CHS0354_032846 [Potamilus streckersoni]|uniref:PDZ domain-containing protein n=1 Tax=Potamilus streckersoni TaxID=2493646 RepID=A0AAE0VRM3_9BIVA|nr:hypothetical protein CHS0354_032846 [Potamilus streckersoni]
MNSNEEPGPSLKALKKMSIKRQNLERATESFGSNLEQLQRINEEQDIKISESLNDLQREQEVARALLGKTENSKRKSTETDSDEREVKQIREWSTADVIKWQQKRGLNKFIFMFQRHHVTGEDLCDLNLPFLDDYEHITVEEREVLLGEIYALLNPKPKCVSQEDLSKIKSQAQREKYLAAIQLAQPAGTILRSSSVLVLGSEHPPTTSSSNSSPAVKPRHKSESSASSLQFSAKQYDENSSQSSQASKSPMLPTNLEQKRDSVSSDSNSSTSTERSTTAKKRVPQSLFDNCLKSGTSCIKYIELERQVDGNLSFVLNINSRGHVTVKSISDVVKGKLQEGDRILEVNGKVLGNLSLVQEDVETSLQMLLDRQDSMQLVVIRNIDKQNGNIPESENIENTNSDEWRWKKMRSLLVQMMNEEPESSLEELGIAVQKDQVITDRYTLENEIKKLKEQIKFLEQKNENLQQELDSKTLDLQEAEDERDQAISKLHEVTKERVTKNSRSRGGSEYYSMTMESLNIQSASKEEVVDCLKEIVKEASRQKWYLDHLISVVIDEAPWMLEEVDADIDSLTITDQSEEFC